MLFSLRGVENAALPIDFLENFLLGRVWRIVAFISFQATTQFFEEPLWF
jgi:hypothetical protein